MYYLKLNNLLYLKFYEKKIWIIPMIPQSCVSLGEFHSYTARKKCGQRIWGKNLTKFVQTSCFTPIDYRSLIPTFYIAWSCYSLDTLGKYGCKYTRICKAPTRTSKLGASTKTSMQMGSPWRAISRTRSSSKFKL